MIFPTLSKSRPPFPLFINCYRMHIWICIFINHPEYDLFSPCSATCMCFIGMIIPSVVFWDCYLVIWFFPLSSIQTFHITLLTLLPIHDLFFDQLLLHAYMHVYTHIYFKYSLLNPFNATWMPVLKADWPCTTNCYGISWVASVMYALKLSGTVQLIGMMYLEAPLLFTALLSGL